MIELVNMWKSITICKKVKRNIKDVEYSEINLNEYMIIDVRSRREFNENHIKGAINIPLLDIKRKIELFVRQKDKKILVYCEYGERSAKAVKILNDLGYINVFNLKGGLEKI